MQVKVTGNCLHNRKPLERGNLLHQGDRRRILLMPMPMPMPMSMFMPIS